MHSLIAVFTAVLLWLSPAESNSRFTKYKISSSSGTYSTTSDGGWSGNVISVSFKTTGRPVVINIQPDTATGYMGHTMSSDAGSEYRIDRDSTTIAEYQMSFTDPVRWRTGGFNFVDVPSAGTYTYGLKVRNIGGIGTGTVFVNNMKLIAYELP